MSNTVCRALSDESNAVLVAALTAQDHGSEDVTPPTAATATRDATAQSSSHPVDIVAFTGKENKTADCE